MFFCGFFCYYLYKYYILIGIAHHRTGRQSGMKKDAIPLVTNRQDHAKQGFSEKALRVLGEFPEMIVSSKMNSDFIVDEALSQIGLLYDASRVYVMLDEKDGKYLRNTHEWVNNRIGPSMFSWPLYDYEYDIPSLKQLLEDNNVFFGEIDTIPQDLRTVLGKQGVLSFIIAPLMRNASRIGLLGMDFCEERRKIEPLQAEVLRYFARLVSITLERKHLHMMRSKLIRIRECIQAIEPFIEKSAFDECEALTNPSKPTTLLDAERRIITETLELYNGNKLKTAKHLGLTWPSLDRRCKKLGIEARRK